MRVLVVPKWYPWPDRPVFGLFCREQSRAIARRHDVVVLASDATRRPAFRVYELHDEVEAGLRTLRVRYRRPVLRPLALGCQLLGLFAALRRLRREGWVPDVVHAHVYSAALAALPLARRSRAPLVVTEHYTGFGRGLITGYERVLARIAFRAAAIVAAVSQDLADQLAAFGARPERTVVVPNVVDDEVFHPDGLARARTANAPPRLLTVAALAAKKGHRDLFAALGLAPLAEQRPQLELIGEGPEHAALAAQAASAGLDVHFDGERPKPDVAERMRGADLFVLPSHHENLPCVLLEAQSSGLPAVATAVGGVPELIDPSTGVICPPHDPASLAAAIAGALERRREFDPVAMHASAAARYGYDAFAARWTELYEQLATRERGPRPEGPR